MRHKEENQTAIQAGEAVQEAPIQDVTEETDDASGPNANEPYLQETYNRA